MSNTTDVTLTTAEKNFVFNWLQEGKYDPIDFKWEQVEQNETHRRGTNRFLVSRLIHKATKFFFAFGGIYIIYSPGNSNKTAVEEHLNDWYARQSLFMLWLQRLSYEVNAPDLWASVSAERDMIEAARSDDLKNKAFSRDERKAISTRLDGLKARLLESQSFAQDHANFIEEQFRYMRESSERLGRKDWLNVFITTLLSIATTVLADDQKRKWLLQSASETFKWIWTHTPLLN